MERHLHSNANAHGYVHADTDADRTGPGGDGVSRDCALGWLLVLLRTQLPRRTDAGATF
jgi:hypothetical protein